MLFENETLIGMTENKIILNVVHYTASICVECILVCANVCDLSSLKKKIKNSSKIILKKEKPLKNSSLSNSNEAKKD